MRKSKYPKQTKTFGQKVRKKRMDLGKSLLEIAQSAGITESYLSRIENDKQIPLPHIAIELAKALGANKTQYLIYVLRHLFDEA